jgi:alpha-L-rhamnosidase
MKKELIKVSELRCNYLENPVGVETVTPRFSWILTSPENGQYQKAYRILVANNIKSLTKKKGILWDSGKVKTDCTTHVPYAGRACLKSRQRCYWQVYVYDKNNNEVCSEPAFFEMGLIKRSDWQAKWVCATQTATDIDNSVPAPLLRKTVSLNKKIVDARVYVSGLGYYELYLNGTKVSDEVLQPPFTRYDRTVMYNTYDVTNMLSKGENVIGMILGNGWYNCFTEQAWYYRQAPWRHHPKMLFQMHVRFDDGSEIVVMSDKTWRTEKSPIVFDGLRNGEFYDARLEKNGWLMPGYDDSSWGTALIARVPGGLIKSAQFTPIRITKTIKPVSLKEVKPGVWVYDLGQNIAGWAQISVTGEPGTELTLKYAEKINQDGTIDQSNIAGLINSGSVQTDKYILSGKGTETWHPRFTYHGFQYVQVIGYPGKLALDNLCGQVVHTGFETYGGFECSNDMLNKIQNAVLWSTVSNYHGIPTDCPHREKNGWTGDASLSAEQVLFNYDPASAYTKWMNDFQDMQQPAGQLPGIVPTGTWGFNWGNGPAWDSAMVLIPWYMYVYLGDLAILEKMYDNIVRYVDYLTSMADTHIVDFGLGDWCPPVGRPDEYKSPLAVTDTAYYYVDTLVLAKTAKLLGKTKDAAKYFKLAKNVRDAFRKKFVDKSGSVTGNCQTSTACALYQEMINDNEKPKLLDSLVSQVTAQNYHIDCGILGAKYIMNTLTDLGRGDLAYKMATQTTFPSWGHWLMQGATTLWETWDGNASRNHHMFSDISCWFYKGLAGIRPDEKSPGFRNIIIKPGWTSGLQWARAWHKSMYGVIKVDWTYETGKYAIDVTVPVGCTAVLYLPGLGKKNIIKLKSGVHTFNNY